MLRGSVTAGALGALLLAASGCERSMEPMRCPELVAGDLVVTELRGKQSGSTAAMDTGGQWIELYNASGASIELLGVHLRPRLLDGSSQSVIIVRRSLEVAAGTYVVLGGSEEVSSPPASLDYNWYPDFSSADSSTDSDNNVEDRDLFDSGVLDIEACGVRIDRVVYADLPSAGTYSLGGSPDAVLNDSAAAWCTDASDDAEPTTIGLPGTPRAENHPCP